MRLGLLVELDVQLFGLESLPILTLLKEKQQRTPGISPADSSQAEAWLSLVSSATANDCVCHPDSRLYQTGLSVYL